MGACGGEDEALSIQPVGRWSGVGNILLKEIQCTSSWKGLYGIDTDLPSTGSVPSPSVSTLALSCTLGVEEVKENGCLVIWDLAFYGVFSMNQHIKRSTRVGSQLRKGTHGFCILLVSVAPKLNCP